MQHIQKRFLGLAVVMLLVLAGCSEQTQEPVSPQNQGQATTLSKDNPGISHALEVANEHARFFGDNDDVVGYGASQTEDGKPAIMVFTARALGTEGLPAHIKGIPVIERVTGRIFAYQNNPNAKGGNPGGGKPGGGGKIDPKGSFDPIPIGVSTGRADECASGTIGFHLLKNGTRHVLSNAHVFAKENLGSIGSQIVQPGRYDLTCGASVTYATLSVKQPLLYETAPYTPLNDFDGALAQPTGARQVINTTPPNGYGQPGTTVATAYVGMPVMKYGRTTGQTSGAVIAIGVTVRVQYSGGVAAFRDQIAIESLKGRGFSSSGDSGSGIVTDDEVNNPVALLFAGGGRTTFASPMGVVLSTFGATMHP